MRSITASISVREAAATRSIGKQWWTLIWRHSHSAAAGETLNKKIYRCRYYCCLQA